MDKSQSDWSPKDDFLYPYSKYHKEFMTKACHAAGFGTEAPSLLSDSVQIPVT
jgi:hypothetical protein